MRSRVLVLALGTVLEVAHAEGRDPDARFAAAVALEGKGELTQAAVALRALADDTPTASVAPDALAEACDLYDHRLFQPGEALACWRALLEKYPQSRAASRARTRVATLSSVIAKVSPVDRAALTELEALLARSPEPTSRASVRALLSTHPTLPSSRAHAWLAQAAAKAGDLDEALREDEAAITTPPDEWSARALRDECEFLVRLGRYRDASLAIDRLARLDDDVSRVATAELRHAVRIARNLRLAAVLAWAWLALYLVAALVTGARLWPVPREARFIAPLLVLFVVGALFEAKNVVVAIAEIGAAGIVITWLAASARRHRYVLALAASVAVLAVAYLVVRGNDLTSLVFETLRSGPER